MIINKENEKFKPVTITFTFESQDEVDAFTAIFNFIDNCVFLENYEISAQDIRNYLPWKNIHDKTTELITMKNKKK